MSDPTAEIQPAAMALLTADAGLAAAFGASPVRIFDFPPSNAPEPYVVAGEALVVDQSAECLGGVEVEQTFHVWSRTDPPGKVEAMTIGAAVIAALCPADANGVRGLPALALTSCRLIATRLVRAQYLADVNKPETAHGVIVIGLSTDPL